MTDDLLILGTDTDAGKTTFAALWLSAFPTEYEYWKPVETGEADSERIRRWVPAAVVHPSLKHFPEAVAPLLAARTHGQTIPASSVLAARKPIPPTGRALLVETFGSPFSPLNENELQISLVERLGIPAVVVTSSAVGAVGRMLQSCQALRVRGIEPIAAILVGTPDAFAL